MPKSPTNKESKKEQSDFDTPWKQLLAEYFPEFVAFFLPHIYHQIAWKKGYSMHDALLLKLDRKVATGNRIVDKLVQVFLHDGQELVLFIHIEVQGNYDTTFAERMLIYRCRLYDILRKPILSCAILTDSHPNWRPQLHRVAGPDGCYVEVKFKVIKLLDYRSRIDELEKSSNLFALVVLACLEILAKYHPNNLLEIKVALTNALYHKSWSKEKILGMYSFIDWAAVPA